MAAGRDHILKKYHLSPDALLSSGMEAEVYAYGPDSVLKIYPGTVDLGDLRILRDFYGSLDRQLVPYALPRIHKVVQEDGTLISIEQKLIGAPLSTVLPSLKDGQLDAMMQRYLNAALALSRIQAPPTFERYKLFDPEGISNRTNGDWHRFLNRFLTHKLTEVSRFLSRDVPQFEAKVQRLCVVLDQPYRGDYQLIHGDYFPGNLLINDEHHITALLDFGLLTMYGDYLFDIATGWVFFDMYDELEVQARDRYLAVTLERLGEQVRGRLYRYVLIYSILSANTYSPNCGDGHYQWCVTNLRNQHYWDEMA
jgi:hypothetical protein